MVNLDGLKQIVPPRTLWIGADGALRRNASAQVGVVHDPTSDKYVVRYVSIANPPKGGVINLQQELNKIVRIHEAGLLASVAVDRSGLYPWISYFEKNHIPYVDFDQGRTMEYATEFLLQVVQDGRLVHPGDARLTKHIAQGRLADTSSGGIRFSKSQIKGLDQDALIALAMSIYHCQKSEYVPGKLSIWRGDIFDSREAQYPLTRKGDGQILESGKIYLPRRGYTVTSAGYLKGLQAMSAKEHDVWNCPGRRHGACDKCENYFREMEKAMTIEEYEIFVNSRGKSL